MTQPITDSTIDTLVDPELLDFFEHSYGPSFVGREQFSEFYLNKADTIVCTGENPYFSSVGLLRHARITAVATSPNRQVFGSRRSNLTGLFGVIHEVEAESWVTIGENASNVQKCAKKSGMKILEDVEHLKFRVKRFDGTNDSIILNTPHGLAVTTVDSVHGANYMQNAWGWLD